MTSPARSAIMRAVRSKDTKPEIALRRMLYAAGYRYRLHRKDLPGSPDIALPGRRKAVFVHGCFWHGHDCKRGARRPKDNADYWTAKLAHNRARDAGVQAALAAMGWECLTVWECETAKRLEPALLERLTEFLGSPGVTGGGSARS